VSNSGGSIDNDGDFYVAGSSGDPGIFAQGAGIVATGSGDNPIDLLDNSSLDLTGSGAGAFEALDCLTSAAAISVDVSGNLAAGQSLTIENAGAYDTTTLDAAGSFTSAGTISYAYYGAAPGDLGGGDVLALPSGDTVTNTGSFVVSGDDSGNEGPSDLGEDQLIEASLVNDGTLDVGVSGALDPYFVLPSGDTLTNAGTLDIVSGTLEGLGPISNESGTIELAGTLESTDSFTESGGDTSGAAAEIVSGSLDLAGSGAASFAVPNGDEIDLSGNVAPAQTLTIIEQFAVDIRCTGTYVTAGAGFTNSGTIDIDSGCPSEPDELAVSGTLTNNGTIDFGGETGESTGLQQIDATLDNTSSGTIEVGASSAVSVTGETTNDGTIAVSTGTLSLNGGLTNFDSSNDTLSGGSYEIIGTSVSDTARLALPSPTDIEHLDATVELGADGSISPGTDENDLGPLESVDADGRLRLDAGASLSVSPLTETLVDDGTIDLAPAASLEVIGSYTEDSVGTLSIGIDGAPGSDQIGTLDAHDTATLAGTLAIETTAGFTPASGATYTPLTVSSPLSGEFSSVTGTSLGGGLGYATSYTTTSVELEVAPTSGQLVASGVSGPSSATVGGQLSVSWSVEATEAVNAAGWEDAAYLSPTPTLGPGAILLGIDQHSGGLGLDDSYDGAVQATTPGVVPGTYYLVVEADAGDQVLQGDRAEDVAASSPLPVSMQTLAVGGQTSGTIPGGGNVYLEVQPGAGSNLELSATFARVVSGELLESYGGVPSPSDYEQAAANLSADTQSIGVSGTLSGDYFVDLADPDSGPVGYSLSASAPAFVVSSVSPSVDEQVDRVPGGIESTSLALAIEGSDFAPGMSASLTCGSDVIDAASVTYAGPSEVYAQFSSLASLPSDSNGGPLYCSVGVESGSQSAELAGAVEIGVTEQVAFGTGQGGGGGGGASVPAYSPPQNVPSFSIETPSVNRPGFDSTVDVTYTNPYGYEIPAPLFELSADGATLHYATQSAGVGSSLLFVGTAPSGDPAVLGPGQSGSVEAIFDSTLGAHQTVTFTVDEITDLDATVQIGASLAAMLPAAPPAVTSYVEDEAGTGGQTTIEALQTTLDADVTYLAGLGESASELCDGAMLLGFELNKLDDYGAMVTDYTSGPFGLGLPGLVDTLGAGQDGTVTVTDPTGAQAVFAETSSGSYVAQPGITSSLAATSSPPQGFVLTQPGGATATFDASGQLVSSSDGYGQTTTYSYDGSGRLTTMSEPDGDVVSFAYGSDGLVASMSDALSGDVVVYAYDAAGHLVNVEEGGETEDMTWNEGNSDPPAENTLASVSEPGGLSYEFSYDSSGRLTAMRRGDGTALEQVAYNSDGSVSVTDGDGSTTTYYPDAAGESLRAVLPGGEVETAATDQLGEVTSSTIGTSTNSFTYDSAGELTSVVDPLGQSTSFSYDGSGDLASFTSTAGNTTAFSSNSAGDPTAVEFPDGSTEQIAYTPAGLVSSFTERDGTSIGLSYDSSADPTGMTFSGGGGESFAYGPNDQLESATDAAGTTSYTYTPGGQLAGIEYPNGLGVSYTYDAAGQLATATASDGYELAYSYDSAGLIASVSSSPGGTPLVSYTYTADEQLSTISNANGTATSYTYDDLGEVASVTNTAAGGTPSSSYTYTRNGLGEATSVSGPGGTTDYSYDAAGELISASLPGGRTITYAYDADGNFTAVADSSSGTTGYAVDGDDEYTSAGSTTYSYDANGDLTSVSDAAGTTDYEWNALGELVEVSGPSGTTSYTYDALGTPLSETTGSTTTDLLADPLAGGELLGEYGPGGTAIEHYLLGDGVAGLSVPGGESASFGFDGSADVVSLAGESGDVTDTYSYLPWGSLEASTGSTPNPYLFAGQYGLREDGASGLVVDGAREYDPSLGRFVSQDPTLLSGPNPYEYAANDPIDNTDVNGRTPVSVPAGQLQSSAAQTVQTGLVEVSTAATGTIDDTITAASEGAFGSQSGNTLQNAGASTRSVLGTTATVAGLATDALAKAQGLEPETAMVFTGTGWEAQPVEATGGKFFGNLGNGLTIANGVINVGTDIYAVTNAKSAVDRDKSWGNLVVHAINVPLELAAGGASGPLAPIAGALIEGGEAALDNGSKSFFNYIEGVPPGVSFTPTYPPGTSNSLTSSDPNEIVGPSGYGTAGYVPAGQPLPYEIDFANESSASLPAQTVTVTEQLDPSLDLSTFSLGSFGFADHTVTPPPGARSYSAVIDDSAVSGLDVDVNADLDSSRRTVTWSFTSIDPSTGLPTTDTTSGFLPPDAAPPEGEGFVSYSVAALASAATGTTISAAASVVFDANAPIETSTISNTIDGATPSASLSALPVSTTSPFTLSWSGSDAPSQAGIASYDVWISTNGGAYVPLETNTTTTSTSFSGTVGDSYSFIATATDNVGNGGALPTSAQASTTVVAGGSPGAGGSSSSGSSSSGSSSSSSTPAASGSPPPQQPAAVAVVNLRPTRLAYLARRLRVDISCAAAACDGTLRLERVVRSVGHGRKARREVAWRVLGSARLSLAAGRRAEVRIVLDSYGRSVLASASARHVLHLAVLLRLARTARRIAVSVT